MSDQSWNRVELEYAGIERYLGEDASTGDSPNLAGRPILLLHGLRASRKRALRLQRHLRATTGRVVVCVPISMRRTDLRDSARRVDAMLTELARTPGFESADLVGHSTGGLVASYLLKRLDHGRRVRNVVTLDTPHRGTPAAIAAVLLLGFFCEAVWQRLPNSSFVRDLKWTLVPSGSRLISIRSTKAYLAPLLATQLAPLPGHENVLCETLQADAAEVGSESVAAGWPSAESRAQALHFENAA